MQWLALWPHRKKVLCLNLVADWGLPVWSLHLFTSVSLQWHGLGLPTSHWRSAVIGCSSRNTNEWIDKDIITLYFNALSVHSIRGVKITNPPLCSTILNSASILQPYSTIMSFIKTSLYCTAFYKQKEKWTQPSFMWVMILRDFINSATCNKKVRLSFLLLFLSARRIWSAHRKKSAGDK